MGQSDLPDWTTQMDQEILEVMTISWVLTPATISSVIDRSREGISRRLNTLEAGGLVDKKGRGQYQITDEALSMVKPKWGRFEPIDDLSVDQAQNFVLSIAIQNEFGVSKDEYLRQISEEEEKLREEGFEPESGNTLIEVATKNVEDRLSE